MKLVFAFCGPIGSGKSSVSKLFAARTGAGWTSFGRTVAEIAMERGLTTDRQKLQELGAKLVTEERGSFCKEVVARAKHARGGTVVIDGVRHLAVLEELRSGVSPCNLICVYVDSPRALRLERVK